jgi:hypothetical protein
MYLEEWNTMCNKMCEKKAASMEYIEAIGNSPEISKGPRLQGLES